MRIVNSLFLAFSTYSRIPVPQVEWTNENQKTSMCFFPLVGAFVGAAVAVWLWLCERLGIGALLQGVVGALLPLWMTGGIHMDGLMDTSDALASWQTRQRRLEILKDSHTGAFAVMACCGYLLLTMGLLSEATLATAPMLGMVYVASRALSAWTMTVFQSARPQGMLNSFARAAQKRMVGISSAGYLALCAFAWGMSGGWLALLCMATCALCVLNYRHMAYKYFGGVTGDLAGWFVQITEAACMAAIILGGKAL